MRVTLCGVRGSTPAPGAEFVRYGGHTSCVAIAHDGRPPSLVLDAGTGLQRLTRVLGPAPFQGTILLGHLHWDHVQGMPFFAAGARPGATVHVRVPEQDADPEALLARMMSPPNFPIAPAQLGAGWRFSALQPGEHDIEGFSVLVREIPHKGGRTFGFRVSDGRSSIGYLSDHAPLNAGAGPEGLGAYHDSALALADRVDLLLHDAQHTAAELPGLAYLGHSAADYAVGLGRTAGARGVVLFHHAPERTDDEIDALVGAVGGGDVAVIAAVEGTAFDLPLRPWPASDARRGAPVEALP